MPKFLYQFYCPAGLCTEAAKRPRGQIFINGSYEVGSSPALRCFDALHNMNG